MNKYYRRTDFYNGWIYVEYRNCVYFFDNAEENFGVSRLWDVEHLENPNIFIPFTPLQIALQPKVFKELEKKLGVL